MEEISLKPAYVWTCECCGRTSFHQGIVDQGTIEKPLKVLCVFCGEIYLVKIGEGEP